MSLTKRTDEVETAVLTAPDREVFNVVALDQDTEAPASFDDAMAMFAEAGIEVERSDKVMQDAFPELDKDKLVNRECVLLFWQRSRPESEEYGGAYVLVRGITRDGVRFRFTDGGTGVAAQLIKLTTKRIKEGHDAPNAGLHCPRGLTLSTYTTVVNGQSIEGKTYYIAAE